MYRRPSKKKELIRNLTVYTLMTSLVIAGVAAVVLFILGFQFDANNGRVEQGLLVQFATSPTGATVEIDGRTLNGKTPTKSSALAGMHTFTMKKDGYETWTKTLDVKAGTLLWLNYARLIPTDRPTVAVSTYKSLFASLATGDGQAMLVQQDEASAAFGLVDLSGDTIAETAINIPAAAYSQAATAGVKHTFHLNQWDTGGRYVLVEHTYDAKKEWIILDTKDVAGTKNITALLGIDISSAWLSGTSGNILYVLSGSDIRKLDLSAATISRTLVSGVSSFELYDTHIITYAGTSTTDPTKRVVGLYREGDAMPHVLRSVDAAGAALHVATSHYFNKDYIAISEGTKVDILAGDYPTANDVENKSLELYGSFELAEGVDRLGFSAAGSYVLAQNGSKFGSFDIEHKTSSVSSVVTTSGNVRPLQWLDDAYLWSDADGVLTTREFDGANSLTINKSLTGQDAVMTKNGRYIYSFNKTDSGYQLQRVRIILP